jgi:Zn-dependent peptidase ImmA (M78 family)
MALDYAGAVRNGALHASRLHAQLDTRASIERQGGNIDVFGAMLLVDLPLLVRPLQGLLGAYISDPIPGVLITTKRPLSIQRFTAAHELGHFRLGHEPSLDDETILRRMASVPRLSRLGSEAQEVEADSFAVTFMMPLWIVQWHCQRQNWKKDNLRSPHVVYQLSLRMGASFEATTWTLQRYKLITPDIGKGLRETTPRELKVALLAGYKPTDYRGDVWILTERDAETRIDGSRNDHFILRLNEHSGGGYLWNVEQLKRSGFAIVGDNLESSNDGAIGSHAIRNLTAHPEFAGRGKLALDECRPWQPNEPLASLKFDYDFTGPEEEGLSRAERRQMLEAA